MKNLETDREQDARQLAERLFFKLEKRGSHYGLSRVIGGFDARDHLIIEEVEQLFELWKLEGPHGG
jgi:hypothetical protein